MPSQTYPVLICAFPTCLTELAFVLSYCNEVDIVNLQLMSAFLSLLHHFSSDPNR